MRAIILAAVMALVATHAIADGKIVGRASVVDGDTVEIRGDRIRLHGIDAPEASQQCQDAAGASWPCGRRAAMALADRIGAANIECEARDRDRYGRTVAVCRLRGEDLNGWLVSEGLAMAYRRYSLDYVDQEAAAAAAKRGIWQGPAVAPWDYRKGQRIAQSQKAQPAPAPAGRKCGTKTKCGQMTSCDEAMFYLTQCGVRRLDGDKDGIPCEKLCR